MLWFSFCWLKSSDADGLGSFSAMLPTKAEEADLTGGDGACCPRGDRRHGCSCHFPAGPSVQRGGPHQVIPPAEMSTAINNLYPPQRGRKKKVMAKISKTLFLPKLGSFPGGSVVKNLSAKQETRVWSLGWGRSPGGGNGNPLRYSCLGN